MLRLLLISLFVAIAAFGLLAYQLLHRGGRAPEPAREQTTAASPVRSIPIRPREETVPPPAPPGPANATSPPTVPGDVSRTLDDLRTRDSGGGQGGPAVSPAQIDALRAQAERRHVRPVTRMAFPLEPGTVVPPQVYLHPVPPELTGLGAEGDPLGFIQIGDKFVLVGTVSRRIIGVARG